MQQPSKTIDDLHALLTLYSNIAESSSVLDRAHIGWMCAKLKEQLTRQGDDFDTGATTYSAMLKLCRWLGFIQGWLYSWRLRSLPEMQEETRGIDPVLEERGPPAGVETRRCRCCGVERTVDNFYRTAKNTKLSINCMACEKQRLASERERAGKPVRRVSGVEYGSKLCLDCSTWKPASDFWVSHNSMGGLKAACRTCFRANQKNPEDREKRRVAALKWRTENKEKVAAISRLACFKRRYKRTVATDGTVTDEFLVALYETATCVYCKRETPRNRRTADHVIPLVRGGPHSAANLVMACRTCNISKGPLTDVEYIERERVAAGRVRRDI